MFIIFTAADDYLSIQCLLLDIQHFFLSSEGRPENATATISHVERATICARACTNVMTYTCSCFSFNAQAKLCELFATCSSTQNIAHDAASKFYVTRNNWALWRSDWSHIDKKLSILTTEDGKIRSSACLVGNKTLTHSNMEIVRLHKISIRNIALFIDTALTAQKLLTKHTKLAKVQNVQVAFCLFPVPLNAIILSCALHSVSFNKVASTIQNQ